MIVLQLKNIGIEGRSCTIAYQNFTNTLLYYNNFIWPTKCIHHFFRFGAGFFAAARAAVDASSSQVDPFTRQPKFNDIDTNEIPEEIVAISPSRYIPTFRGTYAARSPYWSARF